MRLGATRLTAISQARSLGSALWDVAGQRPSLDLRFAESKSLVDSVSGQNLITFTRASDGTFVDSDGVIRSATTNLLLRSEEFDNASWVKAGVISSNQITAPDGVTSADLLTATAATFSGNARQDITAVVGQAYTSSVYVKKNNWRYVGIRFNTGVFGATERVPFYDFDTDTVSNGGVTAATVSRTLLADGWVRLAVTFTATTTSGVNQIWITDSTGATQPLKAGTESVYLWGAQLEQSSTVGPYIPTTSTINSAPRFDHNPLTGECLGLLVEEQRQNLLLNSATLSTQTVTVTAAAHTLSFNGTGTVTLTGTSTAGPLVGTGANARASLTFTPTAGSLTLTVSGSVTNANLELGSFGTSWIPTTGTAATRTADVVSITGTNFSSWYRQDEGTILAAAQSYFPGTQNAIGSIFNSASPNDNRFSLRMGNTLVTSGAVQQASFNPANPAANVGFRLGFAYRADDIRFVPTYDVALSDTSATLPVGVNTLEIGKLESFSTLTLNGPIRRLTYWPQRLPNSTLQSITL